MADIDIVNIDEDHKLHGFYKIFHDGDILESNYNHGELIGRYFYHSNESTRINNGYTYFKYYVQGINEGELVFLNI